MNIKLYVPVEKHVTEIHFVHPVNGKASALCVGWDKTPHGSFVDFTEIVPEDEETECYIEGDDYLVPLTNVAAIIDGAVRKKVKFNKKNKR